MTLEEIEKEIEETDRKSRDLLSFALGGGGYAQRAMQSRDAAAGFERCAALFEERLKVLRSRGREGN